MIGDLPTYVVDMINVTNSNALKSVRDYFEPLAKLVVQEAVQAVSSFQSWHFCMLKFENKLDDTCLSATAIVIQSAITNANLH